MILKILFLNVCFQLLLSPPLLFHLLLVELTSYGLQTHMAVVNMLFHIKRAK